MPRINSGKPDREAVIRQAFGLTVNLIDILRMLDDYKPEVYAMRDLRDKIMHDEDEMLDGEREESNEPKVFDQKLEETAMMEQINEIIKSPFLGRIHNDDSDGQQQE